MKNDLFIDGCYTAPRQGQYFESINPATGKVVFEFALANLDDVNTAVENARIAFNNLCKIDPSERARLVWNMAVLLENRSKEIAVADATETGKPLADCEADVEAAANILRYFSGMVDKVCGSTLPVQNGYMAYTTRLPWGVVAAIVPWNYPIFNAVSKVAPALAMGNSCILKPAEQTSRSALILGEIAHAAGFPPGSLNVITGPGAITGAALSSHMDVNKISFTGSTEIGREIMRQSANSNLKSVTLELGGKSPLVIFEDANLDAAVDAATFSVFANNGQTCTATTRILVQNEVFSAFVEKFVARTKQIVVGNPEDSATHVGAIVSSVQYERIRSYAESGVREGATLAFGNIPPQLTSADHGFFIKPIIFINVKPEMKIAQDEIFGPIAMVFSFDTEEKAIQLANDTQYGLAASIWTSSSCRLHRMIEAIEAGVVWANCIFVENPAVPVGGFKHSGFGKEYGFQAAYEYTREKSVWIAHKAVALDWPYS